MQLNLPEVHGFKVEMGVGPNPKGNGKALNVWLTPATPENAEKMRRAGQKAIQGCLPISLDAARLIELDPLDERVEKIAARALQGPALIAKVVAEA
jgi:hypothetical protein